MRLLHVVLLLSPIALACADRTPDDREEAPGTVADTSASHTAFWEALEALCGQAFEGRIVESQPPDPSFEGQPLVMHLRGCQSEEIRIPFFVGENRSRTWVITPTATGLRLKHDHRHEDGSEDAVTQYGGDTRGVGTSVGQDFYADDYTGELVPAAANNVWTIEVHAGRTFVYALRREGSDRRFRVEFDLASPIEAPPAPWGGS